MSKRSVSLFPPPTAPVDPRSRPLCQIVLETEFDNNAALSLYESLGFIREKRLYRFYLNGKDAFRLVLEMPAASDDDDSEGDSKRMLRYRPSYRDAYADSDDDDEDEESSR